MTSPEAPRLDTRDTLVRWATLVYALHAFSLGIIVVWLPLGVVTIWLVYRIVRGWVRLAARQPMYAEPPQS